MPGYKIDQSIEPSLIRAVGLTKQFEEVIASLEKVLQKFDKKFTAEHLKNAFISVYSEQEAASSVAELKVIKDHIIEIAKKALLF